MAKKISDLTLASSLGATDQFEIVQGGASKRVAANAGWTLGALTVSSLSLPSGAITLSAIANDRVLYSATGTGVVTGSANLTFNGTTLTAHTLTVSTGNLTVSTGQGIFAAGSASLPGIALGAANNGFYRRTASVITVSPGGNDSIECQATALGLGSAVGLKWGDAATISGISAFDVVLVRDTANTLAQRNGANSQEFRVYNTFTNGTNYEFGKIEWASNVFRIGTEKGSGGGTARDLSLVTDDTVRVTVAATTGVVTVASLAGTGTRTVVVDANGVMSAP